MPYTTLKSFERGLDTRRLLDTTEAGGLINARDCHITRGGEIEKRAAFVEIYTMPANTVGFYVTPGPLFHTFGSVASISGLPSNLQYHPIPDPDGAALMSVLWVEEFLGEIYVVGEYAGQKILHWWKDTLIRPFQSVTGGEDETGTPLPPPDSNMGGLKPNCTFNISRLVGTWLSPGGSSTPFALPASLQAVYLLKPNSTYNFGSGGDAFSLIPTDSTDSLGRPIATTTTFAAEITPYVIASTIANLINTSTSIPSIRANVGGPGSVDVSLTVWADVAGAQYNGWQIYIRGVNLIVKPSASQILIGGIDRIASTGLISTFDGTLSQEGEHLGTAVLAHDLKMYAVNGSKLRFSKLKDATTWVDEDGAENHIDMTMIAEGTPVMMAMADYEGSLAIFCKRHIMIWQMDVLPEKSYKRQILHRTGLIAPHARVAYGQGDVMYLDHSGIRSLRTRSAVNQAYAADLGTLIDDLVLQQISVNSEQMRWVHFWAEVEPRSGRLWMALNDKIFVLSYYPQQQIAAWSWYDASTCPVEHLKASDDSVYWRSGDRIMAYGGYTGQMYDNAEAMVRLPYVDAATPATHKNWTGIDVALYGAWSVQASFDPTQSNALDLVANVTQSTYAQQKIALNGQSPSVSFELRSTFVGPARIGNATVHFTDATAD